MSEPDEAMVEAVAAAIDAAEIDQIGHALDLEERLTGLARAALSVPVVRDALARDAQVREIVAGSWLGGNEDRRPVSYLISDMADIAALYPSPGDRDDSEEQR